MKQRYMTVITLLFVITTVLFGSLWIAEKNDNDDVINLAQLEAQCAYESFARFEKTGEESAYLDGVASFKTYQQAYLLLVGEVTPEVNYFNSVYGYMTLSPEKVKAQMPLLNEALALLSEDIFDPNGYLRLSSLFHALREAE